LLSNLEAATKGKAGADLLKSLTNAVSPDEYLSNIRSLTQDMQVRLGGEVSALGSRANINLIIGNAISFIGIAVLGYFVFTFPKDMLAKGKEIELGVYFISRLSLVVFIEIFAYFFLRLYRYSLFEIKYFQNEMTNAEFRAMSLEAGLMSGDKDTIKKICADMSKTERNFILKKGETTLGLRMQELEQAKDKTLLEEVDQLLDRLSKASPKPPKGAQ
jgi:hypothetical protein